jgi:hypothetical protein
MGKVSIIYRRGNRMRKDPHCGLLSLNIRLILFFMSRYTKANHRIFMQFVRREVWHVTFLEPGLQRPLPKTLTFKDEGKIRELARRGEAWQTPEDRQLLDYAIAKGEGGVYLRLSPEQYARLRRP